MGLKVWINDELYEKEEACISVFDRGLLYGDGVFEGIRAYGGSIFRADDHIDRLYESARAIALDIPMGKDAMRRAIEHTLEVNDLTDAYIRLVVTRGIGDLGLDPRKCAAPSVVIITDRVSLYPPELYRSGLAIVTASTVRNHPGALSPRIKSLNYLNNILAKVEGIQAGVEETLMLNVHGLVAECTGDNIFAVRAGGLMTPSLASGVLDGITRRVVIELARGRGLDVTEGDMTRFDLYTADECFLTGTAAEIVPVVRIDGRSIGTGTPGPVTAKLLAAFRQETARESG